MSKSILSKSLGNRNLRCGWTIWRGVVSGGFLIGHAMRKTWLRLSAGPLVFGITDDVTFEAKYRPAVHTRFRDIGKHHCWIALWTWNVFGFQLWWDRDTELVNVQLGFVQIQAQRN